MPSRAQVEVREPTLCVLFKITFIAVSEEGEGRHQ